MMKEFEGDDTGKQIACHAENVVGRLSQHIWLFIFKMVGIIESYNFKIHFEFKIIFFFVH